MYPNKIRENITKVEWEIKKRLQALWNNKNNIENINNKLATIIKEVKEIIEKTSASIRFQKKMLGQHKHWEIK